MDRSSGSDRETLKKFKTKPSVKPRFIRLDPPKDILGGHLNNLKQRSKWSRGMTFFDKYNTPKHQTLGMSPEQKYREGLEMKDAA